MGREPERIGGEVFTQNCHQKLGYILPLRGSFSVLEEHENTFDAEGPAARRYFVGRKHADQFVVSPARCDAAANAFSGNFKNDSSIVTETARHERIESQFAVLHEWLNNTRYLINVAQCHLAAWQRDKSFSDVSGVGHVRLEVLEQVVSLTSGNSPLAQLARHSNHANLIQFVDGGGYAGMEFGWDIVHLQQRAQHFSGVQADRKIVDAGRGECLSQHQNNFSFRVDGTTAYNIDIAL